MAGYVTRGGNRSSHRAGATVSRRLRTAGLNVMGSDRRHKADGMTVSGIESCASILVDYGIPAKNDRVADMVLDEILSWPQVDADEISIDITEWGAVRFFFEYIPKGK